MGKAHHKRKYNRPTADKDCEKKELIFLDFTRAEKKRMTRWLWLHEGRFLKKQKRINFRKGLL